MFLIPPTTPPLRERTQEETKSESREATPVALPVALNEASEASNEAIQNSALSSTLESFKSQLKAPSSEVEGFPPGVLIEWASSAGTQLGGGKIEALAPYLSSSGVWIQASGDEAPGLPEGSRAHFRNQKESSSQERSALLLAPFFLENRLETWWGFKLPLSRSADLGPVLLQILRSQSVQQIVVDSTFDFVWGVDGSDQRTRWLRKLQIVARQSGVSVIFLRGFLSASGVWPIAIQGLVDCQSKRVRWIKWYSRRDQQEVRVG